MTALFFIGSLLKVIATALGVGASTLSITNYFVAVSDGFIDEDERRILGIAYVILRIAMVMIFVVMITQLCLTYGVVGFGDISAYSLGQLIIVFVLFLNTLLMAAYVVPNTIGPAIQAGSWYALGAFLALELEGLSNFSFLQFVLGYLAWLTLAIAIVNLTLAILKEKHPPQYRRY
jgi:hypothetical protein